MTIVRTYRFKKEAPNLNCTLDSKKEKWNEFIQYIQNLKDYTKCGVDRNECLFDSYNEENNSKIEDVIKENVDDIIKITKWNNDMELSKNFIQKELMSLSSSYSSDDDRYSNESGSALNLNKYNIIENNIYSNNANFKRQKVKNVTDINNYIKNEHEDIKKKKRKKEYKEEKHSAKEGFYKKKFPYGNNAYNKFPQYNNSKKKPYDGDKNKKKYMKKYKNYEFNNNNRDNKNKEKKMKSRTNKQDDRSQNNMDIDGTYAYNYAYLNKNDDSTMSSSVEAANDTIMDLEEEIRNYNL
ncbi:hypothetical protein PFUGPA_00992 [Plasmodium falciparum Palo Alto/Uganda]|uniref:Uncharacterized protein n=3 Tax=Plasmodium falciparum TaxID=5833 RepID=A0A024WCU8_PLAFA|nr:hypothetical protein PFTANZ_01285 [Plasmodium falciparum Tanzania (2000708)]ETW56975.1 hypothetical protein PFUGPA_00992 [Plasmodium falciparum Palo Alto/Uganda]ETW62872.1 hypothetical protein PFMC_01240 [Plasmodium falciparum CAMP/Malaysia]